MTLNVDPAPTEPPRESLEDPPSNRPQAHPEQAKPRLTPTDAAGHSSNGSAKTRLRR